MNIFHFTSKHYLVKEKSSISATKACIVICCITLFQTFQVLVFIDDPDDRSLTHASFSGYLTRCAVCLRRVLPTRCEIVHSVNVLWCTFSLGEVVHCLTGDPRCLSHGLV